MYYKRLQDLRENNGFSQQYIANFLKINRVVNSRYELDNRENPISYLIKLSRLYNTTIDYIVEITN